MIINDLLLGPLGYVPPSLPSLRPSTPPPTPEKNLPIGINLITHAHKLYTKEENVMEMTRLFNLNSPTLI